MKLALFATLAFILIVDQARSEEEKCLFEPTKPTSEVTCTHVELSAVVAPTIVVTTTVDAAAVAAMPMLSQPDTTVKKVAAE